MKTRILLSTLLGCLALAFAGGAQAQYKLGEVLDKGGKTLNAAELRELITGATARGQSPQGFNVENTYVADGKVQGMVHTPRGSTTQTGTWTINDKGQLCADVVATFSGTRTSGCTFYLKAGEEYFFSVSDSDRDANAFQRRIGR